MLSDAELAQLSASELAEFPSVDPPEPEPLVKPEGAAAVRSGGRNACAWHRRVTASSRIVFCAARAAWRLGNNEERAKSSVSIPWREAEGWRGLPRRFC